ncbi:MAG: hypothetical protein NUV84_02855 [Candidatus Uhrbacteria bacterium]|nr:hypothetical protein [Candidatus Uhrbacteria bacterium]
MLLMKEWLSKYGTLLNKDGQVVAFLRAGDYKNKHEKGLWLGMLNVDSHYKGHTVATAFTKEMVTMLGEDQTLFADVFPVIDAGVMYVERLGFQIVGISDPMKTGNPAQQRLLLKRRMEGDETTDHVTRTQREAFRIPEDASLMIRIVDKLTGEGKVGTRYETDLTDPKMRWITFSTFAEKGNEGEVDLKRAA